MIQLNPADRLTFEEYLTDCRTDKTFPNAFYVFLHPFLLGLQETSATARPAPISKVASENPRGVVDSISRGAAYAHLTPVKNNSDEIIDTVWSDFGYVSRYFWVGKKRRRGTGSEDVEETNKFDLHSDKVEDAKGEGPGQGVVRFCLSSYFMEWSSVYLICLMFCQKKMGAQSDFPLQIHIPGYQATLEAKPTTLKSNSSGNIHLELHQKPELKTNYTPSRM